MWDFFGAFTLLLLVSPLLVIVAILVRLKLGSPIFFKQERLGFNGQTFIIWKFRSMTNAVNADGELLEDEFRLTRFGKLMRDWSVDELPL